MADNRIYLRCKVCGGELFLGKRLGAGYYRHLPREGERAETLDVLINKFFDEHEHVGCWREDEIFGGYDCFELYYEDGPDTEEPMGKLAEAIETIKKHCQKRGCEGCPFETEDFIVDDAPCSLLRATPNLWQIPKEAEGDRK